MIDKLLQQVNTLEGKFSELEGRIFVTQRVNTLVALENMIGCQEQWYSRCLCLVVKGMTEPNTRDDRDVDKIAATLEKETGVNKDIILYNIIDKLLLSVHQNGLK